MSFDHVASHYDNEFTLSEVGKRQRAIVYRFLQKRMPDFNSVFEVNCGTGADAYWLAQQGKKVLATDISPEMIQVALSKAKEKAGLSPEFKVWDATKALPFTIDRNYDLLFSDFGGLNCLDAEELKHFLLYTKEHILKPGGSMVLVLMSKGSIWESLFFLKRLQWKKAFRRWTNKGLDVHVDGKQVMTYYYNPSFFKQLPELGEVVSVQTVGFFLPPSYMESLFRRFPKFLDFLYLLEKKLCRLSFLAGFADHYLIELRTV